MKRIPGRLFAILLLVMPVQLLAQVKEPPRFACFLENATEVQPVKPGIDMGTKEMKLVLSSLTDTLVRACADAVISVVQRDENGKTEIVYYHRKYWFWLSGLSGAAVRKDQRVKSGEVIGYAEPGDRIELLLYDFETPIDPKKYVKCGDSVSTPANP
jgi:hypothetical protein